MRYGIQEIRGKLQRRGLLPLLATTLLLAAGCTRVEEARQWANPFDPAGENWFPPSLQAMKDTVVAVNDTVYLRAEAEDVNGTIAQIEWSLDGGGSWIAAEGSAALPTRWPVDGPGSKTLLSRARDNDGLFSNIDTVQITVRQYRPSIISLSDTVAAQRATVVTRVEASDTNGTIEKYFWAYTGQPGWDDSTDSPVRPFSKPEGGAMTVRWGVRDDDGLMIADTFRILFNRGPGSVGLEEPRDGAPARIVGYSYIEEWGTARVELTAADPDMDSDTLTYTLRVGANAQDLKTVHSGTGTSVSIPGLSAATEYHWQAVARDLFGDSISASGTFVTADAPAPPSGMVLIRAKNQTFSMGAGGEDPWGLPVHDVTFSRHYWMHATEVTASQFAEVLGLGSEASGNAADSLPATGVTWYDAILFCNARSRREGLDTVYRYTAVTGSPGQGATLEGLSVDWAVNGYRLPTEAEWEYACRGESTTPYFWGELVHEGEQYGWFRDNSAGGVQPVRRKKQNPFGLYDVCGNAWEWCHDWFDENYYAVSPKLDPRGPQSGAERVLRGGSWQNSEFFMRSATRSRYSPNQSNSSIGFRMVLPHP
jgi:formylglycine-generating enzyme required for sulfatase activity